jgi:ATP-dependent protease HslVU (ClpYQ) peptidase subunit
MSVVVCKVNKDKIEMASDSILVRGWSKLNNAPNKMVKMMKYNEMIIGGCGNADEISLFFHYMKTHTIEDMDEKNVLDFAIEFKRWKAELTGDGSFVNPYIIAYKGKAFAIEGMLVFPIDDYYAIGAGQDYANGALYMGAGAKEAVKAACELCAMVCEPIMYESILK